MALRILIVDDNELMRSALRTVLPKTAGWEVCGEAVNGVEAIEKATELKPDVIILDLVMPEMDGLQAARAISSMVPEAPIVLHTWHANAAIEQEARKSGVRKVVGKGVGIDELITALEEVSRENPHKHHPANRRRRTGGQTRRSTGC